MIIEATDAEARVIQIGYPVGLLNLKPTVVPRTIEAESAALVTDRDIVLERTDGATVVSDMQLVPQFATEKTAEIAFSSSDENVATVDETGFVTHVSDGPVTVTATIAGGQTFAKRLVMTTEAGATVDRFHAWAEGSFGRACYDAIESRIAGKTADEDTLSIYSVQNHLSGVYVRNPNCWAADLDLTPISPWNSHYGHVGGGVLLAPDIVGYSAHLRIGKNKEIRFTGPGGEVIERTIVDEAVDPDYDPQPFNPYPDWAIGKLDSDVPGTIGFVKILPSNWADYLTITGAGSLRRVPGLMLDQYKRATIGDASRNGLSAHFGTANEAHRASFNRAKIYLDSGNPGLLTDGTDLIILCCWTYGGYYPSGSGITFNAARINAAMTALGSPYQLTEYDLSAFPTYD